MRRGPRRATVRNMPPAVSAVEREAAMSRGSPRLRGAGHPRRVARAVLLVAALAAWGTAASQAFASFPGRNGKIAYSWIGDSAYRAGPTAMSIRTVDPSSRRVRVLHDCPLLTGGVTQCTLGGPRYAPDGSRIAFPAVRIEPDPVQPWQYFPGFATMTSTGAGFEEHAGGNRYSALAWSPAGDRLLVQRQLVVPDAVKPAAIFLASLDGSELDQIGPGGASAPDWSSTGQVAFTRARMGSSCHPVCSDIYVMSLRGTPRRLTRRGGSAPSWSPHGTKLAFSRLDLGRTRRGVYRDDIHIVGRDGRGLRRLTRRGGYNPAWSPDGAWIAFTRDGDLYVVRTNGQGLRRLVDAPSRDPLDPRGGYVASLDWQPLPRKTPHRSSE